jgi:hypothetical protein
MSESLARLPNIVNCEQTTYQGIERGSRERYLGIDPFRVAAAQEAGGVGVHPTWPTVEGEVSI